MSFYEYLITMLQEARRVLFTLAGLRKIYFRDEETDQIESKWELVENKDDQAPTQEAIQPIGEMFVDSLGFVNDVYDSVSDFDVSCTISSNPGESLLVHNSIENYNDKLSEPSSAYQQSTLLITDDTTIQLSIIPATPIILYDKVTTIFSPKSPLSIDDTQLIKRDKPRSGSEISTCSTLSCPDIEDEGFEVLGSEEGKVEVKASKSSKKRSKKKSSAVSAVQNTVVAPATIAASSTNPSETLKTESSSASASAHVNAANPPVAIVSPLKSSLAPKKRTSHHKPKHVKRHIHWGVVEEILFARSVALSSVPNKGLYPLGLGCEARESGAAKVSVDNHFREQQILLRERFATLGLGPTSDSLLSNQAPPTLEVIVKEAKAPKKGGSKKATATITTTTSSSSSSSSTSTAVVKDFAPTIFESRQFDFRPISNPLFGPLSEYDRISVLDQVHGGGTTVDSTTSLLADTNREIKVIQSSRQNHPSCTCKPLKIDKLSVAKMRSELLSISISTAAASSSSFTAPSAEQNSDGVVVCSPVSVTARRDDGGDADGEGSNHAQDQRKVFSRDEVEKLSKAELVTELREVLRHCQLCMTNQCECYQLNIPCSSYGCPCLRRVDSSLGQSCANPFGYQLFSAEAVKAYRQEVLSEVKSKGLFVALK